jgi:hypothetical protein
MSEVENEVQAQLREVVQELRSIHYRLLGMIASLPAPAGPESPGEDETAGTGSWMRATLECVLVDRIRPAIEDLRTAAEDTFEAGEEGP